GNVAANWGKLGDAVSTFRTAYNAAEIAGKYSIANSYLTNLKTVTLWGGINAGATLATGGDWQDAVVAGKSGAQTAMAFNVGALGAGKALGGASDYLN